MSAMLKLVLHLTLIFYASCMNDEIGNTNNATGGTAAPVQEVKEDYSETSSFLEWQQWENKFVDCNPLNNSLLSPVNIITSKAVRDEDGQTLNIYSSKPPPNSAYTFNTRITQDGIGIDVASIGVKGTQTRETTQISGLGSRELLYFHRAIFLFSNSEVEPERSLHQINGKKFPMEIVMYFKDIAEEKRTQVHVLVEFGDKPNPGLHWMSDVVTQGLQTNQPRDDNALIRKAQEELTKAEEEVKALNAKERSEMGGHTYATYHDELQHLYNVAQDISDTQVQELQVKVNALPIEIQKLEDDLGQDFDKQIQLETDLSESQDIVRHQLAEGVLLDSQENDDTDKVKLKQSQLRTLKDHILKTNKLHTAKAKELSTLNKTLVGMVQILQKVKIGSMEGAKFPSVQALKVELDAVEKKKIHKNRMMDNLARKREKLEDAKKEETGDVPIELQKKNAYFQISWLLPSIGGFYSYEGSDVIPPCTPATNVLVMEKPISITKDQFLKLFEKIPNTRTKQQITNNEPITYFDKMIPPLRDLGNRVVKYNPKNLQFKTDDGFHMRSALRRKIKDELASCAINQQSYISTKMLMYIFLLGWVIDYFNYCN